jgi:DNA-binding GntR family transcriptional regulator
MTERQVARPAVIHLVSAMRDDILRGALPPGHRLVESELIESFSAKRNAVRQALMILEREGLIERQFNRGAHVRSFTLDQAIEIMDARVALEGLCAAKAAERATAEERKALLDLGSDMQAAIDLDDVARYSAIARQLHIQIRQYARHTVLNELLDRLNYQSVRYHFSVLLVPGRPREGMLEHLEVIRAVASGTPDEAEKVMREHLLSVIHALERLAALRTDPLAAESI